MTRPGTKIMALAVLTALSTGCSAPVEHTAVSAAVTLPGEYGEAPEYGAPIEGWCSDFGDADLEALTDRALSNNFTLLAGWARVEQASAMARQAGSAAWPMLDAQLGAGRSRSGSALGVSESNMFSASLPAAYEVDLWGRIGATIDAADLDALAARSDVESMAITVVAQVAEAWFDVVQQRAARQLLGEQIETNQMFLDLVYFRMGHGQASAPDVLLQQQQIEALEAELEIIEARRATAEQRLAVLVGEVPQVLVSGDRAELPELPEAPSVGVPADLLDQRPDVRSARFRLSAADHRLAAAIAARLPAIRLTGSVGLQATEIVDLLAEIFWSVAGSISASIFDGGRRNAEVDRSDAVVDERLYTYAQTLLVAMQEVESALVLERQQLAFIERLAQRAETSQAALDIERERYRRGVSDYLRVLTALRSVQQIERTQLDARRQLLSNRITLCRAVGGEWTRELTPPRSPREEHE